ncbi:uncharacterized protein LOC142357357, partial [Convolutriloba macropyga]|uniref:uncharacterized protein LOC142357357 n=1 Tax=Convolutriloba macropyga TaxID=536237 RepID=UPI003F51E9D3
YKIMDNDMETAFFSSFQLVIACDLGDNSTSLENRCFVIMEYEDVNYSLEQGNDMHFAAGLKQPAVGLKYKLPEFATEEVDQYQYTSNFGVPGFWVFELNQYPDASSVTTDSHFMAPFAGIHDDPDVCPDAVLSLSISMASMLSTTDLLSFGPCPFVGSMGSLVKFNFKGTFQKTVKARPFDEQFLNFSIVQIPIWGVNEEIELRVTLDGVTIGGPYRFYFTAPGQVAGETTGLLTTEKMADKVLLSWDGLDLPEGFVIIQVHVATSSDHVDGFSVDETLTSLYQVNVSDVTSFEYTGTVGFLTVFKMTSFQLQ